MEKNSQNKDNVVKLFITAAKSHHRVFENNVKGFGIHRSQHRILMFLSRRGNEPTSQKDIANFHEISPAAVAVSIKKLENEGLIKRVTDKNDNRANLIELTQKGQDIVEQTKCLIGALDAAMFEGFCEEEILEFSLYLSRLCDNIKKFDCRNGKE